jgi:hypothetical protein
VDASGEICQKKFSNLNEFVKTNKTNFLIDADMKI